jgi:hypothetical protein
MYFEYNVGLPVKPDPYYSHQPRNARSHSFVTAGALMHDSLLFFSKRALKTVLHHWTTHGWIPFVIHYRLQALPHPMSIRAGVIGFHLSPIIVLFHV